MNISLTFKKLIRKGAVQLSGNDLKANISNFIIKRKGKPMQNHSRSILLSLFITACFTYNASAQEPGTEYRACDNCPEMVVVPEGSFLMGSPSSEEGRAEDEGPQHQVHLVKAFGIGKYEVTRGQFRAFVEATSYRTQAEQDDKGCFTLAVREKVNRRGWTAKQNWRNAELYGLKQNSDDHPVLCISLQDTQAYIMWLNETQLRAGKGTYRLPTEAEWEYAARAGTNTLYSFGTDITTLCEYGNGGDLTSLPDGNMWREKVFCEDGHVYTASAGSFRANGFGLYDMQGNVWEWTEDCWHDHYNDAPTNGEAWEDANGGDCSRRVARGGAWWYHRQDLRVAFRFITDASMRSHMLGFRLAQDLP